MEKRLFTILNVLEDGTGKVDAGLGKDIQIGKTVTIASTDCVVVPNKEGEKIDINFNIVLPK